MVVEFEGCKELRGLKEIDWRTESAKEIEVGTTYQNWVQDCEEISLKREVLVSKVLPGLIFLFLWLDGWFFPLIIPPFPFVLLVEKKNLQWLGFGKQGFKSSIFLGLLASVILVVMYYPIRLYYFSLIERTLPSLYDIFTDVFWYPLYEEVAYRSFFLVHFAVFDSVNLST